MSNLPLALVLLAAAGVAAMILNRRGPDAPTQQRWAIPAQLDRGDFAHPARPWLVVAFTSAACDTCADLTDGVATLEGDGVAVEVAEVGADKARHDRYGIDAVPTVLVADAAGVVRASFVGPVSTSDLQAMMSELRDAGPTP